MARMVSPGYHSTRKKPSGKHEARWGDETGRLRQKSFVLKSSADSYAMKKALEADAVAAGRGVSSKELIEALDEYCGREDVNEKTRFETRRAIEKFIQINKLTTLGDVKETTINDTLAWLRAHGHNPGGQQFVLRRVHAFLRYCIRHKWLMVDPFPPEFEMPSSDHEGVPLTEAQFARLVEIRRDAREDLDTALRHALIIGRYSMARPVTIWELTPASFRNNGTEMNVPSIKKQKMVWSPVHPEAVPSVRAMLAATPAGERLFSRWNSVQGIHDAVRGKCAWLTAQGYPLRTSFHQACKVTQVTALDNMGVPIGKLSHLSNTTKETLLRHYVKADRDEAFGDYLTMRFRQTTQGPRLDGNTGSERGLRDDTGSTGNEQNAA